MFHRFTQRLCNKLQSPTWASEFSNHPAVLLTSSATVILGLNYYVSSSQQRKAEDQQTLPPQQLRPYDSSALPSNKRTWMFLSPVVYCEAETSVEAIPVSVAALRAEHLYNQFTISRPEVLSAIEKDMEATEEGDDAELLWRFARAKKDVADLKDTPKDEAKKLIYEAQDIMTRALELDDKNFAIHKWVGIILSAVGDYEGTKASIANAFVIRDHWLRAVELNPKDATSHHLLGRWCMSIADIPWVQRKIAAALFATPPEATFGEALEHFLDAESISPGFWKKNCLMIAECYIKLKDTENAKKFLKKALDILPVTEEDKESHLSAQALLKSL